MSNRALSRSAVRAGVVALSLAALTAGGSAVALQTVSLSSPTAAPTAEAEPEGSAAGSAGSAPDESDDGARATVTGKPEPKSVGEDGSKARGKIERTRAKDAAKAQRRAGAPGAVPLVEFPCDPSRSHGQNVSAYARSLPKGPGRGRQVSQAARSDCGKPTKGADRPQG